MSLRLTSPSEPRVSFDGQAHEYEARAGLPEPICREVAALLLDGVRPSAVIVDVGAGTGTIGRHLAAADTRYVALDLSQPMLIELARSLPPRRRALVLRADADRAWPIADGAADLILFSRSAHLLKREQTLAEVLRIAAPGCRVFIGRARRPRDSAGEQLKRTMQHLLRDRAVAGRNGERARRDFLEALERHGARPLDARVTSSWPDEEAPLDSLTSWRSKEGLGGRVIPDVLKAEILDEVERWARAELGDLTTPRPIERYYELQGVQLAQ